MKLDSHKKTSRPYCENHMRSILESISYVEDSQKLLKGRLVKPWRHALGLHSPSTFQEELLGSAEHCGPSWNRIGVKKVFYQKIELFGYKYIFQKLLTD